jgi:hypothetical protein
MAIDPTHIRSGNVIYDDSEELMAVESIDITDVLYADYNPVPLTEAILTDLGFRKINEANWWEFPGTGVNVRFYTTNVLDGIVRPGNHSSDVEMLDGRIAYVHSLQNYFFSVTGQELTALIPTP